MGLIAGVGESFRARDSAFPQKSLARTTPDPFVVALPIHVAPNPPTEGCWFLPAEKAFHRQGSGVFFGQSQYAKLVVGRKRRAAPAFME
jgi:hypothetical protein